MTKPAITVISDLDIQDGSSIDGHFKFMCDRGTTMAGFRDLIKAGHVQISTRLVWLLVGNSQILVSKHISPMGQIKKLVNTIIKVYPLSVQKIVVAGVLPRPDREVELEPEVKHMNKGLAQGVQELKRFHHVGKRVTYEAVQKLFLEWFKYCNISTGQAAVMIRIVQPKDRFFIGGTPKLNLVGLYHLKSYMLQYFGILKGINSWTGIPTVSEHREMQEMKRAAWLKAHDDTVLVHSQVCGHGTHSDLDDTDVEDELEAGSVEVDLRRVVVGEEVMAEVSRGD